ncbi:coiled-coil domain-containing protein 13-like [Mizuhopecten yessoensis]|uniref:Coiled-coil domain-containing protein 13 n=1 Tax=Mizuhopecten yessoensis TaxID=6573 RepID=A0A210QJ33_MIZYE|nr:coiled-coil domain-containing protein 13-like [Mizuhopecten yessoensis]OWF48709.1 Coiled-coil domain-containing protein 13 [Mizuhopecten yessoensis]
MEDTGSETLKQQFQLLQEQQQKKLQRRKQRQDQKEKSSVQKPAAPPTFGVEDQLDLKLADPVPKGSSYLSEELVEHLNQQIRELKDENGRVYKLLSEKDFELRNMKKKREEDKSGASGLTNETAATKIVELSKKVRELTSEMEVERTKSKQLARKCMDLSNQISSIPQEARSMMGSAVSLRLQAEEKSEDQVDVKAIQDKLKQTESKVSDYRNQISSLKQELKIVNKVLSQEIGDNVNVQSLLNTNSSWRGRSQQILGLQARLEDLRAQLASKTKPEGDLEKDMMGMTSSRRRTADDRHREQLRKLDKERKESQEKQANELKALEEEHEALKTKLDASKTRNKVLANEIKSMKGQMQTCIQKGHHDDELIEALMRQQSKLQKLLEESGSDKMVNSQQAEAQLKHMSMKAQQDSNIVQQLKVIVTEKESKVHQLEDEIRQLKRNHLHKAQEEGVSQLFQHVDNRPPSSIPSSRPMTCDNNIELDFTVSSVTPTQSRLSERPPSGMKDRPLSSAMDRPLTSNSMLDSSRVPSRKSARTPTNNHADRQAIADLTYQCQEYHTVMQATEVERDRLSELVQVVQNRMTEQTERLTELQNELVQQRRKNALLEKQIGKNKVESQNMINKSSSAVPRGRKQTPGRASSQSTMSANPLSSSMMGKDMLGAMDEEDIDTMNIEEVKTNLEIQRDENEALKTALQSTLKAKDEDLQSYYNIMEETKKVFLQALRQYKQNVTGT